MTLDSRTKTLLTIIKQPLNPSADIDGMGKYLDALWSGQVSVQTLEDLVEQTCCIEQIETFAAVVPGADVDHLNGVVAVIEVMEA